MIGKENEMGKAEHIAQKNSYERRLSKLEKENGKMLDVIKRILQLQPMDIYFDKDGHFHHKSYLIAKELTDINK